jgi:phosphatidylserine/phosphatidylglycerophosphate/cardiolipin synthase-like enzyme
MGLIGLFSLSAVAQDVSGPPAATADAVVPIRDVNPLLANWLTPMKPIRLPPGVAVHFAPQERLDDIVVALINASSTEVIFNEYAISNQKIATAIMDAFLTRKVFVTGILEGSPGIDSYRTPEYFVLNGLPVLLSNEPKGLNNNKYIIIDRQIVITGSFDATYSAANGNHENLIIIRDPAVAAAYFNAFLAQSKECDAPLALVKQYRPDLFKTLTPTSTAVTSPSPATPSSP